MEKNKDAIQIQIVFQTTTQINTIIIEQNSRCTQN